MTWKPKNQSQRDWLRGVEDALALVSEWDKYVDHPYRLSDCIAGKLNLKTNRQIRKNRDRVSRAPDQETPK